MRILLACKQCQRRYDASRVKIGARVRCHCGLVMRVRPPKARDAAVVRCSGCGAPCEKGSPSCKFCHSDFTLHDQDLHTVCPNCLTRVSDRARFCHNCGERLTAEAVAGEKRDWSCPECGQQAKLHSRRLGKERVNVGECQRCAGLWIAHESFEQLRDRAVQKAARLENAIILPPKPAALVPRSGRAYRPCVRCGELMIRRQYASSSGVIIDICRDHGIWFDAQELQQVLDWISRGGHLTKWESPRDNQPTPQLPSCEPGLGTDDPLSALLTGLARIMRS